MHLIEIDVIDLQSAQAGLAGATDMIGGEPAIVGSGLYRLVHFGGQHDPVATSALRQSVADDLLGFAEPLRHVGRLRAAIDVGRIEELMPASKASSMIEKLLFLSVNSPKFMVPSAKRLTFRPVRPRCV